MAQFYQFETEIDGKRVAGAWALKQGGRLCVSWLGVAAETVEIGNARPEAKAEVVLRKVVRRQLAVRERERRAWEAKGRRLSPSS